MANPEAYHPALFFSGKHYWRKIFVTSCMFAVMLDALFLYIPVINHDKSCVGLDKNMKVAALVSRIVSDLFYVIDIVVQIYTSEHCPRLVNEFGKRKYSSLLPTITKMIWRSYIIIDILAILPFPQIARRTEALHCQNSSSYHLPRRATSKINLVIIFLTEQLPVMARRNLSKTKKILLMLDNIKDLLNFVVMIYIMMYIIAERHYRKYRLKSRSISDAFSRIGNFQRMVYASDVRCINSLRMDRHTFSILCSMLRTSRKLRDTRNVSVEEMVAMFLHILAHHEKNRVIQDRFLRSGETISRYFNVVLRAVLCLQGQLLKTPEPVSENSSDEKWKWFKNCLGALDGTYIRVHVPEADKPRYRSRKNEIATNVLGVCSQDMQFIYVLPGWEGSAADSRVLRDAISRRHGFRVPHGYYYLVDAGYPNGEGFLAPYRGQRYHLNDWREGYQPTTPEEFFNMKHSSARNVIERCFGLLKMRWAILRSPSFFPVKTQCRIVIACCLLHNLIRREMAVDPLENQLNAFVNNQDDDDDDIINFIDSSEQWNDWRRELATQMFNEWRGNRNIR